MAYYKFAESILAGKPIDIYGGTEQKRDFTYIDDVVEAVVRVSALDADLLNDRPSTTGLPQHASALYRIFNVGNQVPVSLPGFVDILEHCLGHTASQCNVGAQPGDVLVTYADTRALEAAVGVRPTTPLSEGLRRFADWFLEYRARPAN
jgi:UDP-glucuronate 4-epimerase